MCLVVYLSLTFLADRTVLTSGGELRFSDVPHPEKSMGRRIIHGVPSSKESAYVSTLVDDQQAFQCDGWFDRKYLKADSLNDDFCDCADGSDEPGTSACPNSKFYCRNKGHLGNYIFSSRVNDGICDCCDGSDEIDLKSFEGGDGAVAMTSCPNTCAAEAETYWKEHAEEIKRHEEGAIAKKKLVEKAIELIESYRSEIQVLQGRVKREEGEVTQAKDARDAAKAKDDASKDERIANARVQMLHAFGLSDSPTDRQLRDVIFRAASRGTRSEAVSIGATAERVRKILPSDEDNDDDDNDGGDSSSSTTTASPVKDAFERLQEITSADNEKEESVVVDEDDLRSELSVFLKVGHLSSSELETVLFDLASKSQQWNEKVLSKSAPENGNHDIISGWREQLRDTYKSPALTDAESDLKDKESKARRTKSDIEEKEKTLKSNSWGAENEWISLKDACFAKKIGEYEYKVCVGQNAKQGNTNLGSFDKIERMDDGTSKMVFLNGQKCWNGPKRSMTVTIECGLETELLSVEEPSMCTYTSIMRSPAACDLRYAKRRQYDLEGEKSPHTDPHEEL
eukprot:g5295.t1